MDTCLCCAVELSLDGYARICSVCKKDCCVFCAENEDGQRICPDCRTTAFKVQQYSTQPECRICGQAYPATMFYNCRACEEETCFNCIRELISEVEGFCMLCTDVCTFDGCNILAIQDSTICGICNTSCAMCPAHILKRLTCRDEQCDKELCIKCTRRSSVGDGASRRKDLKKYLFCKEHTGTCDGCKIFIHSKCWRSCEQCQRKSCKNCALFPIVKDICIDHTVQCSVCTAYEVEPGYTINGFEKGPICWQCLNIVQEQLQTLCKVWNHYQQCGLISIEYQFPFPDPIVKYIGVQLLEDYMKKELDRRRVKDLKGYTVLSNNEDCP